MTVEWLVKRRLGVACFLVLSPSSRGCRNSTKAHAAQTKCYASNLSLPRECRYTLAASLPVASPLSRALYGTRMRPMLRTLRSSLSDRSLAWLAVLAVAPFLHTGIKTSLRRTPASCRRDGMQASHIYLTGD
jgi:hypothetical protein